VWCCAGLFSSRNRSIPKKKAASRFWNVCAVWYLTRASRNALVSDRPNTGDVGQRSPTPHSSCKHCGGMATRMEVLDSRQGKNYSLLRCLSCEKLSWTEE
jgi:hypothetical protein